MTNTPAPDADREREIARLEKIAAAWALVACVARAKAKQYDTMATEYAAEAAKLKEQRP